MILYELATRKSVVIHRKRRGPKEFDEMLDEGKDISDYLDVSKTSSSKKFQEGLKIKRVNVDFPAYIVNNLDMEARKIGITRQSLIKMWIAEKLSEKKSIVYTQCER